MKQIILSKTVARVLELLSHQGMSKKNLHNYTHTGFGSILRYFKKQGVSVVTEEALDTFLLEQRINFEQGVFSIWKWGMLRRGCELLKYYMAKGSVSMTSLKPWLATLNKTRQYINRDKPTVAQLADPNNIFSLVWKTNKAIMELGLADATAKHYEEEGLAVILNRHYAAATEQFSEDIVNQLISEKRLQYENGLTDRCTYQNIRKAAFLLFEMHKTGAIHLCKIPNWNFQDLTEPFCSLWKNFASASEQRSPFAKSSCDCAKSIARRFLLEMESHGYNNLSDFTQVKVNTCITDFAKHYKGGLHSGIYFLKIFLRFIFEEKITSSCLSTLLPEQIATRKTFHEGFSEEEIKRLLEQLNIKSAVGKRDYAIIVLAIQTGLRACDIVNLKLCNIDWRAREIRIVQHKTGKPLSVPLEAESGNAIADYILNARPCVSIEYLFLCDSGSTRPLKARSASGLVSKYMKKAQIVSNYRAFHALRRTFGTRLLQNDVPFELIQQLLGHSDMNSMKPYLSIDEQGLKACALSLLTSEKGVC